MNLICKLWRVKVKGILTLTKKNYVKCNIDGKISLQVTKKNFFFIIMTFSFDGFW